MKYCSECDHELLGVGSSNHYSNCSFGAELAELEAESSNGSCYMDEDFYDAEILHMKNL